MKPKQKTVPVFRDQTLTISLVIGLDSLCTVCLGCLGYKVKYFLKQIPCACIVVPYTVMYLSIDKYIFIYCIYSLFLKNVLTDISLSVLIWSFCLEVKFQQTENIACSPPYLQHVARKSLINNGGKNAYFVITGGGDACMTSFDLSRNSSRFGYYFMIQIITSFLLAICD